MKNLLLFFFISIIFFGIAFLKPNSSTGIKVSFSSSTLNVAVDEIMGIVEKKIKDLQTKDFKTTQNSPIGEIEMIFSKIKVWTDPLADLVDLEYTSDGFLLMKVRKSEMYLSLDWCYNKDSYFFGAKDSGNIVAKITMSADSLVIVSADKQNKLSAKLHNFNLEIFSAALKTTGGASWLYNFVYDLFQSQFLSYLKHKIVTKVPELVEESVQEKMKASIFNIPIDKQSNIVLDITPNYFHVRSKLATIGINGLTYDSSNPIVTDEKYPLPDYLIDYEDSAAQIIISENSLSSIMWGFMKAKMPQFKITSSMVPGYISFLFSTNSYTWLNSDIRKHFADSTLEVSVSPFDYPRIKMQQSNGIHLDADFLIHFDAIDRNGKKKNMFNLKMNLESKVKIINVPPKIKAEFILDKLSMSFLDSKIGQFDIGYFNSLFEFIASQTIIPKANEIGKQGMEIPEFNGLSVQHPLVLVFDKFAMISAKTLSIRK